MAKVELSLVTKMQDAFKDFDKLNKKIAALAPGLKAVRNVGATLFAGVAAGAGLATKEFADFEAQMSIVRSLTRDLTDNEFAEMNAEAKRLGETTSFTATQAAEGFQFLALAGFDAEEQVASLETVLNLAAAGSLSLASASDIATDSLSALGPAMDQNATKAENLAKLTDLMASVQARANTNVTQLGEAIKFGGGTLAGFGFDVEDIIGTLGQLANAGLKGSIGGTAVTNMFNKLLNPTEKAANFISDFGIKLDDVNGKIRTIPAITEDFIEALDTIASDSERSSLAMELFGQRGIKAFNAIKNQGTAALEELSIAIRDDVGAAADQAGIRLDNLKGRFTLFTSAISGQLIEVGAIVAPILEKVLAGAQGVVDAFKNLDDGTKEFLVTGALVVGVVGGIVAGFATLALAIPTIVAGLAILTGPVGFGFFLAAGLVAAIGAAVGALGGVASKFGEVSTEIENQKKQRDNLQKLVDSGNASNIEAAKIALRNIKAEIAENEKLRDTIEEANKAKQLSQQAENVEALSKITAELGLQNRKRERALEIIEDQGEASAIAVKINARRLSDTEKQIKSLEEQKEKLESILGVEKKNTEELANKKGAIKEATDFRVLNEKETNDKIEASNGDLIKNIIAGQKSAILAESAEKRKAARKDAEEREKVDEKQRNKDADALKKAFDDEKKGLQDVGVRAIEILVRNTEIRKSVLDEALQSGLVSETEHKSLLEKLEIEFQDKFTQIKRDNAAIQFADEIKLRKKISDEIVKFSSTGAKGAAKAGVEALTNVFLPGMGQAAGVIFDLLAQDADAFKNQMEGIFSSDFVVNISKNLISLVEMLPSLSKSLIRGVIEALPDLVLAMAQAAAMIGPELAIALAEGIAGGIGDIFGADLFKEIDEGALKEKLDEITELNKEKNKILEDQEFQAAKDRLSAAEKNQSDLLQDEKDAGQAVLDARKELDDELERQNEEAFNKGLKALEDSQDEGIEAAQQGAKTALENLDSAFEDRKNTIEEALAKEVAAHDAAGKAVIKIEKEIANLRKNIAKRDQDKKITDIEKTFKDETSFLDFTNDELADLEREATENRNQQRVESDADKLSTLEARETELKTLIETAQANQSIAQEEFNVAQLEAEKTFGVDLNITLEEQIAAKKILLEEAQKEEAVLLENKLTAQKTFAIDIAAIDTQLGIDRIAVANQLSLDLGVINKTFEAGRLTLAQGFGKEAKKTNDEMIQGLKDVITGLEKVETLAKDRTSAFSDKGELEDAQRELTALEKKRDRLTEINEQLKKLREAPGVAEAEAAAAEPERFGPGDPRNVKRETKVGKFLKFIGGIFSAEGTVPVAAAVGHFQEGFVPKGADFLPAMVNPQESIINSVSSMSNLGLLSAINEAKGPLDLEGGGGTDELRISFEDDVEGVITAKQVQAKKFRISVDP